MRRSKGGGEGRPGLAPHGSSSGPGKAEEGRSQTQSQPRLTGPNLVTKMGRERKRVRREREREGGDPVTTKKSLWLHDN